MQHTLDWLRLLGRDKRHGEKMDYGGGFVLYEHNMELGGTMPLTKASQERFANGPFVITGNSHILNGRWMRTEEVNNLRNQAFVSVSIMPGETQQSFNDYFEAVPERVVDPGDQVRPKIRKDSNRMKNAENTAIVAPAYVMYDNDLLQQQKAGKPIRIVSALLGCHTATSRRPSPGSTLTRMGSGESPFGFSGPNRGTTKLCNFGGWKDAVYQGY